MYINTETKISFAKSKTLSTTETIVEKPFKIGDISLIPIISITLQAGNCSGSITHISSRINLSALVVIKDDEVSLFPLTGNPTRDKISEILLEMVT